MPVSVWPYTVVLQVCSQPCDARIAALCCMIPQGSSRAEGTGVCYNSVMVSGAEAVQASTMGTYTKVAGLTQGDRPVFQRAGTTMYLFFWPSVGVWFIGSDYSSDVVGARSSGNRGALCPDQATGWQAYAEGRWVSTYPITVAPAGSS